MLKIYRVVFLFLIFLLSLPFIHFGFAQQAGKQVPIKVPTSQKTPNALLYLPWDYNISGKDYPLLCFFHGSGEAGTDLKKLASQGLPGDISKGIVPYSVNKSGDTTHFVVLSIQASGISSPTPETMIDGVETLINDYHIRIDANRIYPTGLSAGGEQTIRAMMYYPLKFSAAVIMSPGIPVQKNLLGSFADNYVWFFQGINDHVVYPGNTYHSNDWINAKYPGHSRLTKYEAGHSGWMQFYDPAWEENGMSIYDFLLQHSLKGKENPAPKNEDPVAKAGKDQTITLPDNAIPLDGTASSDPDGKLSSYKWTQKSGPAQATIEDPSAAKTKATKLKEGTYVFSLTVTDNNAATATDEMTIVVKPKPNDPPTAKAGSNQTITLPVATATLDGSASKDADGKLSSYQWTQKSGPAQATIEDPSAAKTKAAKLKEGTYIFSLTVTDNGGDTATDNITVKVNTKHDTRAIANAGTNRTVTLPKDTIILDGSATTGTVTSWYWSKMSGPKGGHIQQEGAKAVISDLHAGTYTFYLTVSGTVSWPSSDKVVITVKENDKKETSKPEPERAIADAGLDRTIILPKDTIVLDGSATTGTVTSWYWSKESGPEGGNIKAMGAKAIISNLNSGTYNFYLTVSGLVSWPSSDKVVIIVKEKSKQNNDHSVLTEEIGQETNSSEDQTTNQRPIADAGSDRIITLPKDTIILDGSHTTGKVSDWYWSKEAGPSGGSIFQKGSKAVISNLNPGTYDFYLTVFGLVGWPSSSKVRVTVKPETTYSRVAQESLDGNGASGSVSSDSGAIKHPDRNNLTSNIEKGAGLKNDSSKRTGFRVYPNPVHNRLFIEVNNVFKEEINCRIIDINGRAIKRYYLGDQPGNFKKSIDVSNLSKGVYFIQLIEKDKIGMVQKIFKF